MKKCLPLNEIYSLGVVIVSTPQLSAVQVARRGASMLKKLDIPIIGLISNMNTVNCPKCSNDISVFGNHISNLATELGKYIYLYLSNYLL